MKKHDGDVKNQPDLSPPGYEPPRVERVLRPEDVEREMLYAGPAPVTF